MSAEPTLSQQLRDPNYQTAYLCEQAAARLDEFEHESQVRASRMDTERMRTFEIAKAAQIQLNEAYQRIEQLERELVEANRAIDDCRTKGAELERDLHLHIVALDSMRILAEKYKSELATVERNTIKKCARVCAAEYDEEGADPDRRAASKVCAKAIRALASNSAKEPDFGFTEVRLNGPDGRLSDQALIDFSDESGYWRLTRGTLCRMAQELLERRRGEYICPQCGLRNAGNAEPEQDSDGGIPW